MQGTASREASFGRMSEAGDRLRRRARECRDLVSRARDSEFAEILARLAVELEEEAAKADAEDQLSQGGSADAAGGAS